MKSCLKHKQGLVSFFSLPIPTLLQHYTCRMKLITYLAGIYPREICYACGPFAHNIPASHARLELTVPSTTTACLGLSALLKGSPAVFFFFFFFLRGLSENTTSVFSYGTAHTRTKKAITYYITWSLLQVTLAFRWGTPVTYWFT